MGYQRITNLQRDGLQKVIDRQHHFSLCRTCRGEKDSNRHQADGTEKDNMTVVFFASQNTFILRGKTTFAYPFIQFFLGQCLRGGEMFLIFLPIFFILSPNEFQEVYV